MKTNELMIGDWVISNSEECRIWCIDWQYHLIRCHHNGQEWEENVFNITPIPLTEEILEVNGFSRIADYMFEEDNVMQYEYGSCAIRFDNAYKLWHIVSYGWIKISYVHELQHALRLCGLTDLADNFKLKAMEKKS